MTRSLKLFVALAIVCCMPRAPAIAAPPAKEADAAAAKGTKPAAQKPATQKPAAQKPAIQRPVQQTPPGVTCLTEVVARYPEHTVELVIYVPDEPGRYPAILDIHGGGWQTRQIENDRPMMERLVTRGFVTALVSYRLAGEAKYPAALDDCKAAVRYLRAHSKRLKIDPERIGVMGGSAGGHLAGLLAMTGGKPEFEGSGPNQDFSSRVQACLVMAGSQDLAAASQGRSRSGALAFLGSSYAEQPELYVEASPLTHVRAGVPPTIFIEGELDTLKPGRAEMQEKLRSLGIETKLYTLKDAPHPFWMRLPWVDETVDIAADFFHQQLGQREPAETK